MRVELECDVVRLSVLTEEGGEQSEDWEAMVGAPSCGNHCP